MISKECLSFRKRTFGQTGVMLGGEAQAFFSSHLGSSFAGALPPQQSH